MLVGIPASGKTSFCAERFMHTHVRLSLDVLRTRKKEMELFETCLRLKQPTVIDDTNVQADQRAQFLGPARLAGFHVTGYFFSADLEACLARNRQRTGKQRVADAGLGAVWERLVVPELDEGFDRIHTVHLDAKGFHVTEDAVVAPSLGRSTDEHTDRRTK